MLILDVATSFFNLSPIAPGFPARFFVIAGDTSLDDVVVVDVLINGLPVLEVRILFVTLLVFLVLTTSFRQDSLDAPLELTDSLTILEEVETSC